MHSSSSSLTQPSLLAKACIEYLGCVIFHFIGSVSATAVTNGLALMVLVLFCGKVSGANLNPAVSLSFVLIGYMTPVEMVVFWAAQVAGCITGALIIAILVPGLAIGTVIDTTVHLTSGCFYPRSSPPLTHMQLFGWEFVCTCAFIIAVLTTVWFTQRKNGYGSTGPLVVGFSLMSNILAASPFTGGALNPARVLGSVAVFRCPRPDCIAYYVSGELTAAFAAAFVMIPFYGIAQGAWFMRYVPAAPISRVLHALRVTRTTIRLETCTDVEEEV